MAKFKGSVSAILLATASIAIAGGALLPVAAQAAAQGYEFLKAVRALDGTKVETMLGDKPSLLINTKDDSTGETALHIVVGKNDATWTAYLLGLKANPNSVDKERNTPMMIAATNGFEDGIDYLLISKAQVDLSNRKGETALILAVKFKRTDAIKALLRAGANPDKADYSGNTARDYAKQYGQNSSYLALIESGGKDDPAAAKPSTDGLDFSGIGEVK